MEEQGRYQFLSPAEGESLASFLERAATEHEWPRETIAGDLRVLTSLVETLAPGREADAAAYILRALAFSAAPSMALRHLDRYLRALAEIDRDELSALRENPEHLHFLCSFFSFSQYLSEIVIAHPEWLDWAFRRADLRREKPLDGYRAHLAEWMAGIEGEAARREALTRFKKREQLRIGIRDILEMGGTVELCHELSHLAQSIVEIVWSDCRAAMVARHGEPIAETGTGIGQYCIYAMGKLGGGELNFSSDLDLVFVYNEEGNTTGVPEGVGGQPVRRITNHEFFTRLSQQIMMYLMDRNAEGFLFRVDARLRPDGINGPLARSVVGYSSYFASQASAWEKIAYQKMRLLAGDKKLDQRFLPIVTQFVYTGNSPGELLPEIAHLKYRIDTEFCDERTRELDIKRGVGGIREIEFIVSGRQLLNASAHPELRVRPTLEAVGLLRDCGLLEPEMSVTLRDAYHLYRRIEHTLQMMQEAQTHEMPSGEKERAALALRCGYADAPEFENVVRLYREKVRAEFEAMFGGKEAAPAGDLLVDRVFFGDDEASEDLLARLAPAGLGTQEGFRALRKLAVGTSEYSPSARGRREFERILPMLLEELPFVALPQLAVRQFDQLLRASRGFAWVYDLCLSHPPILKLLLRVLGFGSFVGRQLVAHPEWLDELFQDDGLSEARTANTIAARACQPLPEATEEAFRSLRQFKQLETFLLSAQEIAAVAPTAEAAARTAALAEAVLREAATIAERHVISERSGSPLGFRWALIGLGGLGDRQVHVTGDLDVAFVVEDDREWNGVAATRVVDWIGRKMIAEMGAVSPEGQLWKIDARLRPDGKNAPLAATSARFVEYYTTEAGLWEWQVLTKARAVAGDLEFGRAVLARLYAVYTTHRTDGLAAEVRAMRARMEANLKLPGNVAFDLKMSPGGVVDVEFLAQYLALSRPPDAAELFPLSTVETFGRFRHDGALTAEDTGFILDHLALLRAMQRHHRLLWESEKDHYPTDEEKRAALNRGMADQVVASRLPDPSTVRDRMKEMRAIFDRLMGRETN